MGNVPVTCDIIAAILFYLRVTIVIGVILTQLQLYVFVLATVNVLEAFY